MNEIMAYLLNNERLPVVCITESQDTLPEGRITRIDTAGGYIAILTNQGDVVLAGDSPDDHWVWIGQSIPASAKSFMIVDSHEALTDVTITIDSDVCNISPVSTSPFVVGKLNEVFRKESPSDLPWE